MIKNPKPLHPGNVTGDTLSKSADGQRSRIQFPDRLVRETPISLRPRRPPTPPKRAEGRRSREADSTRRTRERPRQINSQNFAHRTLNEVPDRARKWKIEDGGKISLARNFGAPNWRSFELPALAIWRLEFIPRLCKSLNRELMIKQITNDTLKPIVLNYRYREILESCGWLKREA